MVADVNKKEASKRERKKKKQQEVGVEKTWNPLPLYYVTYMLVQVAKGIEYEELKKGVETSLGRKVSDSELLSALLKLEVKGLVHVRRVIKGKKITYTITLRS